MKLKECREAANLTQQEAANILGVHQSAVALWESGKTNPRVAKLYRIAEAYGCSVADLLGETVTATSAVETGRAAKEKFSYADGIHGSLHPAGCQPVGRGGQEAAD